MIRYALIPLLMASTAVAQDAPPTGLPEGFEPLDRVRAVVDSEVITEFELERSLAQLAPLSAGILDPEERARWMKERREEALEEQINTLLVVQEARKLDLEISPAEVAQHVNALKQQLQMDDDQLTQYVRIIGFRDLEAYQEHVEREMLKFRTIRLRIAGRVRPDEDEVDRVFARDYYGGEHADEVHAQHILVRVPNMVSPQQIREFSQRAHAARAKALSDEKPWCELTSEFSDDTNKDACGDLGWFTRCTLDPEFEKAVFAVPPGQISEVVRTGFGFHVIRVLARRKLALTAEREQQRLKRCVRMDLEAKNREKAYKSYTRELRLTHHVVTLP